MNETPYWREEVTSRIESYRARRKRAPRQQSLSLDFERAVNRAVASTESPLAPESSGFSLELSTRVSGYAEEVQATWSTGSGTAAPVFDGSRPEQLYQSPPEDRELASEECNIIEFPRPPLIVMPPSGEELAEPILDKPRILDAPEEVNTAQAPLAGIELEPDEEAPAVQFELPLLVAGMSRRAFAGMADVLLVLLACSLFLTIVVRGGATLPAGKAAPLLLLATPILFWAVYEYLFLVHAGTTPGMRLARLELVSFEGARASRGVRRGRALAMVLSCLSLGLGLLWALLDEDTLCWHDRISRTYMVASM